MRHICSKRISALSAAFLLLILAFAAAAQAAGREAGTVVSVTPGAFVERGGQRSPLEVKAPIYAGDVLITDGKGRLRAWMRDETTLSLGPETDFEIEDYDDTSSKPVFKAKMTGFARMLTGEITKANPAGFKVSTPQATVGIRGTIFAVRCGGGKTTVFVENTLRQMTVNGVTVPSGCKADVAAAGAAPTVSPMTPADRQEIGANLAANTGGQPKAGNGSGGTSSGTMVAAAAPADAPAAPEGLAVDEMLADSSSALSESISLAQAQTLNREATVTGILTDQGSRTGSYTLTGVNLASGEFRSGNMMIQYSNSNWFDLSGGAGVLNGSNSTYHLSGTLNNSYSATGTMTGTVHSGSYSASAPDAPLDVSGNYNSTSVTH